MRKLLLASATTVGLVGTAAAQTTVVQTQAPVPIGVWECRRHRALTSAATTR